METFFCDPSLQLSRRDGFNEKSQDMFSLRNKKNSYLEFWMEGGYLKIV